MWVCWCEESGQGIENNDSDEFFFNDELYDDLHLERYRASTTNGGSDNVSTASEKDLSLGRENSISSKVWVLLFVGTEQNSSEEELKNVQSNCIKSIEVKKGADNEMGTEPVNPTPIATPSSTTTSNTTTTTTTTTTTNESAPPQESTNPPKKPIPNPAYPPLSNSPNPSLHSFPNLLFKTHPQWTDAEIAGYLSFSYRNMPKEPSWTRQPLYVL